MLDREGKFLDLQEIRIAEQAIEINTKGMCCELGEQAGAQAPKGMSMIDFQVKLFTELSVDGFDDLADLIMLAPGGGRNLLFLVAAGQRDQLQAIGLPETSGFFGADVGFVAKDIPVGMLLEEFKTDRQIGFIGWSQCEIQNQAGQGDQKVQFVAKNGLLFRGYFAETGTIRLPIPCGAWD